MHSYFFIPADNEYKLSKSNGLAADFIIADLEDAVISDNYEIALSNLLDENKNFRIDVVRIDPDRIVYNAKHKELFEKFSMIMYPKICDMKSLAQFVEFHTYFNVRIIILIEHPWACINLNNILIEHGSTISGVAFGNHDYARVMGVDKYSEIVKLARMLVATTAKSYNFELIDVASMELENEKLFKGECLEGFRIGFDSKMIIHPKQLVWLDEVKFYTDAQIEWATDIIRLTDNSDDEIPITTLNGQVVEKPHIEMARAIINRIRK